MTHPDTFEARLSSAYVDLDGAHEAAPTEHWQTIIEQQQRIVQALLEAYRDTETYRQRTLEDADEQ